MPEGTTQAALATGSPGMLGLQLDVQDETGTALCEGPPGASRREKKKKKQKTFTHARGGKITASLSTALSQAAPAGSEIDALLNCSFVSFKNQLSGRKISLTFWNDTKIGE